MANAFHINQNQIISPVYPACEKEGPPYLGILHIVDRRGAHWWSQSTFLDRLQTSAAGPHPAPPPGRAHGTHTTPISPFRRVRRPEPRPRRPGPRPVWGTFKHWCLGGARTKSRGLRVLQHALHLWKSQGAVQRGGGFSHPRARPWRTGGGFARGSRGVGGTFLTYRFGASRPCVACDRLRISFLWMMQHNAKSPSLAGAFGHMCLYPSPRDKQTIRLL